MGFDYNSPRAQKARLATPFLSKPLRALIQLVGAALLSGGVAGLILGNALGWLGVGAGVATLIAIYWIKHEVIPLPTRGSTELNGLLSREVLVNMPKQPSLADLAAVASKTSSGRFLALRYGIAPALLEEFTKHLSLSSDEVLMRALEVSKKLDSERVSGGTIAIALIESYPDYADVLAKLKLEPADLYAGMNWYNYLHDLVRGLDIAKHTGGIARDLMFGYTPTLLRFGQNISAAREGVVRIQLKSTSHEENVNKMIQIFSNGGRQNVAVIGPGGSGRHTIVEAFADRLLDADSGLPDSLKFRQIFKLDASAIVGAAGGRGEVENLMSHILSEAHDAKNMIIWLDNAQVFFEEGIGSVDISNLLLPILEAGRMRIILTMNGQRYLEISQRNQRLASTLNKVMVEPQTREETIATMQDRVPLFESRHNVTFTVWALNEAYRLSERYIHHLVMPGRALNLLEAAAGYAENGLVTDHSVQMAVEKTYGIRMQASQTDEDRERLLNMETLIHEQLIGQEPAVKAVSDALRRAAAGVRNENRPIGTFLFLGPTGVGKTELAKAVSRVYFKGEREIVRIDLNEYVNADSVSRLIADGANNELSLAAQVMKNPFSVVLLDEIEKADSKVLTTLLQVLDEGILRDENNREVSFRDTIIIATSNAGANRIREFIDAGVDISAIREHLTNELIHTGEFKPEFLNRFDEICIFEPLDKEALFKIADIILASINKTLESRKISVSLSEEAKAILVDRGYDPKLGARPMRRIIQSSVENIVARAVLSGQIGSGERVEITADDLKLN